MTSPLRGWPAVLASAPDYCMACGGRRVMQVRVTAEPRVTHGRPVRCPHCSPTPPPSGAALPIPLVPWRTDTPRKDAA